MLIFIAKINYNFVRFTIFLLLPCNKLCCSTCQIVLLHVSNCAPPRVKLPVDLPLKTWFFPSIYRDSLFITNLKWTVRGSNPGGGEIFRTCPDRPWGPPSLLYNGYRVFPGGKVRPGRAADHSPPSSAVIMEQ